MCDEQYVLNLIEVRLNLRYCNQGIGHYECHGHTGNDVRMGFDFDDEVTVDLTDGDDIPIKLSGETCDGEHDFNYSAELITAERIGNKILVTYKIEQMP